MLVQPGVGLGHEAVDGSQGLQVTLVHGLADFRPTVQVGYPLTHRPPLLGAIGCPFRGAVDLERGLDVDEVVGQSGLDAGVHVEGVEVVGVVEAGDAGDVILEPVADVGVEAVALERRLRGDVDAEPDLRLEDLLGDRQRPLELADRVGLEREQPAGGDRRLVGVVVIIVVVALGRGDVVVVVIVVVRRVVVVIALVGVGPLDG